MWKKILFISQLLSCSLAQEKIDLSGQWSVELGSGQKASIVLPGTTDEAHLGEKTTESFFGILSREYSYIGKAYYERDFDIPSDWEGQGVELILERVLWQSSVYIDGQLVGQQDSLNSPHRYQLGHLKAGTHKLRICVDNDMIYNIGDKGHAYSEYTQSIWNGIVGKIELKQSPDIAFNSPRLSTSIEPTTLHISDLIKYPSTSSGALELQAELYERDDDVLLWSHQDKLATQQAEQGAIDYQASFAMPSTIKLWSDSKPQLYDLKLTLKVDNQVVDTYHFELGFREVTQGESKILINGKPVMMRGNLDCIHFPLTGYPSCDVADWERIFRIYKDYGLNHVRFHAWCPPQAAFVAADRVGIYIQAETIWIDWWMSQPNPNPEKDTKGHPQGLGKNPSADQYVQKELANMVANYGNHASFVMMCIGNELGNSDFDVMQTWMQDYRDKDARRLYSISTARTIMPLDQYMATHSIKDIGATRGRTMASTHWDYEDIYSQTTLPIIAHEIGQWPVHPHWDEIKKYTGVLKARNMQDFYQIAQQNGVEWQNEAFVKGSGHLNQIMYKHEIESFLRTPSCAGIQLLSMQDYQGQGEALIGWLDVFYDSKGITTPERFRHHCDETVTLARLEKFVWQSTESFTAEAQVAHYGDTDIKDSIYWTLRDEKGWVYDSGLGEPVNIAAGSSHIYSKLKTDLSRITKPTAMVLEIGLKQSGIKNTWNIWVYPPSEEEALGEVKLCHSFNQECLDALAQGEKVLLLAHQLGNKKSMNPIAFRPLYWSFTFFPGQRCNTLGMLLDDKHPIFKNFPTSAYSDWQWESIYPDARAFIFNKAPKDIKFIAQPIDDFHRNNRLGAIFELKVGKGSLLVTGFDLQKNFVGHTLYHSILKYMNSPEFQPTQTMPLDDLATMLKLADASPVTAPAPYEQALVYIDCASQLERAGAADWLTGFDAVQLLRDSKYSLENASVWKDATGCAWHGKDYTINLSLPMGVIGHVIFSVHDWNQLGRDGTITVEGREYSIGKHDGEAKDIKIPVMREDTTDGKIQIKVKATSGPNIMMRRCIFIED